MNQFRNRSPRGSQPGFMMAMIIIMIISALFIITASFVLSGATFSQAQSTTYRQMAFDAARSSLEMAKYYLDGDPVFNELQPTGCDNIALLCTNDTNPRNGMPDAMQEVILSSIINTRYRITTQIINVAPGTDARSKKITTIGRIYQPANSTSPRYSRVLIGEISSDDITAVSPSTYNPMAWYDATCNPTDPATVPFRDSECFDDSIIISGTPDPTADLTSFKEERISGLSCNNPTTPASSTLIRYVKNNTGTASCPSTETIYTGLAFEFPSDLDDLKGKVVTNATLKILNKSNSIAGTSGVIIRGLHQPGDGFTNFTGANNELTGATTTNSVGTVASPLSFPAANSYWSVNTLGLISLIQELIDDPRYANGEKLYLRFEPINSTQARRQSDAIDGSSGVGASLELEISDTIPAKLSSGEQSFSTWRDRSGNGFHLQARSGENPTYGYIKDNTPAVGRPGQFSYAATSPLNPQNEIRHLPAVHLQTGIDGKVASMVAEVRASSLRKANTYTVLAVMRSYNETDKVFNYTGPANNPDGYILTFQSPTGTDYKTITPFWRHPDPKADGTTFHEDDAYNGRYLCNSQGEYASYLGPGVLLAKEHGCFDVYSGPSGTSSNNDTPWMIAATRSQSYSRSNYFRINGNNTDPQAYAFEVPKLEAPYFINLAFNPLNGETAGSVSIGELIIYDRELSCPQIEALETYLAEKWKLVTTPSATNPALVYNSEGCFENNVPTF